MFMSSRKPSHSSNLIIQTAVSFRCMLFCMYKTEIYWLSEVSCLPVKIPFSSLIWMWKMKNVSHFGPTIYILVYCLPRGYRVASPSYSPLPSSFPTAPPFLLFYSSHLLYFSFPNTPPFIPPAPLLQTLALPPTLILLTYIPVASPWCSSKGVGLKD